MDQLGITQTPKYWFLLFVPTDFKLAAKKWECQYLLFTKDKT